MNSVTPITKHICVVEDNDNFRTGIVDLLICHGFNASGFENGLYALAAIDKTHFDLVLTDVQMPEMDGLELLASIKSRGIDLPVVLMSGSSLYGRGDEYLKRGAVDFLLKPFEETELKSTICNILRTV